MSTHITTMRFSAAATRQFVSPQLRIPRTAIAIRFTTTIPTTTPMTTAALASAMRTPVLHFSSTSTCRSHSSSGSGDGSHLHHAAAAQATPAQNFLQEIDRIITTSSNMQQQQQNKGAAEEEHSPTAAAAEEAAANTTPRHHHPVSLKQLTDQVYQLCGRRPRVLLASFHAAHNAARREDALAPSLADIGFDVDISPAERTPADIARMAVEADVHAVVLLLGTQDNNNLDDEQRHIQALQGALKQLGAEEEILLCLVGSEGVKQAPAVAPALVFPPKTAPLDLAQGLLNALLGE